MKNDNDLLVVFYNHTAPALIKYFSKKCFSITASINFKLSYKKGRFSCNIVDSSNLYKPLLFTVYLRVLIFSGCRCRLYCKIWVVWLTKWFAFSNDCQNVQKQPHTFIGDKEGYVNCVFIMHVLERNLVCIPEKILFIMRDELKQAKIATSFTEYHNTYVKTEPMAS